MDKAVDHRAEIIMYEWIDLEIATVKTGKFFCVGLDSENDPGASFDLTTFPQSYVQFMRRFGKAKFFRDDTDCYDIGVYSHPIERVIDGETYWEVGWYDESSVLLRGPAPVPGTEWPVVEESKYGRLRQVAESFDAWLSLRWAAAKSRYGPRKWRKIVEGPAPFTPEELAVVEARRKFRWRLLEVDQNCAMRFELINESNRQLPFLGIGVHGKRRGVWLGIVLKVDHILPGTSGVAVYDRFPEGMLEPDEIEVFEYPDPEPEDRVFYWEFRPMPEGEED